LNAEDRSGPLKCRRALNNTPDVFISDRLQEEGTSETRDLADQAPDPRGQIRGGDLAIGTQECRPADLII
jgi:hypothetical protein